MLQQSLAALLQKKQQATVETEPDAEPDSRADNPAAEAPSVPVDEAPKRDTSSRMQPPAGQPTVKRAKTASASEASAKAPSAASNAVPLGDDAIVFVQTNPKRAGTGAATRYAKYCKAKTVNEALRLGAVPGDIPNDFSKGYLKRA